jgi:ACS family allantoate permease-like MFS transporter
MSLPIDTEKSVQMASEKPFAGLDGRPVSATSQTGAERTTVIDLVNADEALAFLTNHPRAAEIAIEGSAILEDPIALRKLLWKIDLTMCPLLAAVYFLQYLDKTTISYAAVMGIRNDTHLVGQEYSELALLFYVGGLGC